MDQHEFNIPKTGESWRHYKPGYGNLYTVIGMGVMEATGEPVVVYTKFETHHGPPIFVRPLGSFLSEVEFEGRRVPRFRLERLAGSDGSDRQCPYIREVE